MKGLLGGSGGWSRPPQTSGQVGMSMMYSCYVPPSWEGVSGAPGGRCRPCSRPLAKANATVVRHEYCFAQHSSEGHIADDTRTMLRFRQKEQGWLYPPTSPSCRDLHVNTAAGRGPLARGALITSSFHQP